MDPAVRDKMASQMTMDEWKKNTNKVLGQMAPEKDEASRSKPKIDQSPNWRQIHNTIYRDYTVQLRCLVGGHNTLNVGIAKSSKHVVADCGKDGAADLLSDAKGSGNASTKAKKNINACLEMYSLWFECFDPFTLR